MLDKLVQLFIDFLYLFKFWYVIEPYEAGHSFHCGYRGRALGSANGWFGTGFHLVYPLGITTVRYFDITDESTELNPTDLTTKDGHHVKVGGVFRYRMRADKAWDFITTLGDDSTAVEDFMSMAMAEVVEGSRVTELFDADGDSEVKVVEEARRQLNRYGFKILDFYWNYKVRPTRTIRVMTD